MDITASSDQRRQLGIERFLAGDLVSFEGVTFTKSSSKFLQVISFSEFVHPEGSTAEEASEKIERSKETLAKLCSISPEFSQVATLMPHKYEFCHDYGKGSILLAYVEAGELVWVGLS